jgi:hypothetical protein
MKGLNIMKKFELDNGNYGVTCSECNANIGQFPNKMDAYKAWNQRNDD